MNRTARLGLLQQHRNRSAGAAVVSSRDQAARFWDEGFGWRLAFSPDELRGCQAFAGLPSSGVVVGVVVNEEREVVSQLVVVVMVGPFDGRLPDRAVRLAGRRLLAKAAKHPLDLTAARENTPPDCFPILAAPGGSAWSIGARCPSTWLLEPMAQPCLDLADPVAAVDPRAGRPAIPVPWPIGELAAPRHCLSDQWHLNGSSQQAPMQGRRGPDPESSPAAQRGNRRAAARSAT